MDLNKVMLIGRLARDPEMRTLPSGNAILSFGIATNRQWKGASGEKQKQVEFHRAVAWGKSAERISPYLFKGKQVYLEGRLHTSDWVGQDGAKRYRTEIIVSNLILLGGKNQPPTGAVQEIDHDEEGEEATDAKEVIEEDIQVEAIPF